MIDDEGGKEKGTKGTPKRGAIVRWFCTYKGHSGFSMEERGQNNKGEQVGANMPCGI